MAIWQSKLIKIFGIAAVIVGTVLTANTAWAHLPRIVSGTNVTEIPNPEISQAFYGNLQGQSDYYRIIADQPFTLALGLLVPRLPDASQDFSVKVTVFEKSRLAGGGSSGKPTVFFILDGPHHKWTSFYENFAGDNYYQGPDWESNVGAGVYNIEVFNPTNRGKYALVVGSRESFSPREMVKTILTLPGLKKNFFGTSPFLSFFNLIGLFLMLAIAGGVIIIVIIFWAVRKILKPKGKPNQPAALS